MTVAHWEQLIHINFDIYFLTHSFTQSISLPHHTPHPGSIQRNKDENDHKETDTVSRLFWVSGIHTHVARGLETSTKHTATGVSVGMCDCVRENELVRVSLRVWESVNQWERLYVRKWNYSVEGEKEGNVIFLWFSPSCTLSFFPSLINLSYPHIMITLSVRFFRTLLYHFFRCGTTRVFPTHQSPLSVVPSVTYLSSRK